MYIGDVYTLMTASSDKTETTSDLYKSGQKTHDLF